MDLQTLGTTLEHHKARIAFHKQALKNLWVHLRDRFGEGVTVADIGDPQSDDSVVAIQPNVGNVTEVPVAPAAEVPVGSVIDLNGNAPVWYSLDLKNPWAKVSITSLVVKVVERSANGGEFFLICTTLDQLGFWAINEPYALNGTFEILQTPLQLTKMESPPDQVGSPLAPTTSRKRRARATPKGFFTIKQLAERFNCSEALVYHYIYKGGKTTSGELVKLEYKMDRLRKIIPQASVEAFEQAGVKRRKSGKYKTSKKPFDIHKSTSTYVRAIKHLYRNKSAGTKLSVVSISEHLHKERNFAAKELHTIEVSVYSYVKALTVVGYLLESYGEGYCSYARNETNAEVMREASLVAKALPKAPRQVGRALSRWRVKSQARSTKATRVKKAEVTVKDALFFGSTPRQEIWGRALFRILSEQSNPLSTRDLAEILYKDRSINCKNVDSGVGSLGYWFRVNFEKADWLSFDFRQNGSNKVDVYFLSEKYQKTD